MTASEREALIARLKHLDSMLPGRGNEWIRATVGRAAAELSRLAAENERLRITEYSLRAYADTLTFGSDAELSESDVEHELRAILKGAADDA